MQFSDVNAFLTLAATRHTLFPQEVQGTTRSDQIVAAAKAGRVPVHLVSSEFRPTHDHISYMSDLSLQIYPRRTLLRFFPMMPLFSPCLQCLPEDDTEVSQ